MSVVRVLAVLLAILLAACAAPGGDLGEPAPVATPAPTGQEDGPGPEDEALPADRWTGLADAPLALGEVGAAAFGGSVWTAGGLDAEGRATDAVLVYDPTFDGWEVGPALPRAVHHTALVSTGDALYQLGGFAGSGSDAPTAEVAVFDAATGTWEDGPALPEARAAGAAAWDGSRVVYGGGVGPDGAAADVWALEDGGWAVVGALSEPREHLAAASDGDGRVWFLGGRVGGLDGNLAAVDLVEGTRVRRLADLPTARGGVAGIHVPDAGGCVLGGEDPETTFAAVECVDADGRTTTLPPLEGARHGLGAVVVEGLAFAVLGGPEPGLSASPAIEGLPLPAG